MTSTWDPAGGADPSAGSWPPGLGPALPYDLAPEPAPARRSRRAGATALAGVLVIGALGFAAVNLTSADGASSPEAAVERFFDAIDQEDVIGVVESLEPGERRLFTTTVEQLQAEGERLGLAADDADLRGLQGIDLEVEDLDLDTEELADGVVAVELDGTVSTRSDLDELPLGPVITEAIDRAEERDGGLDERASDEIDLDGGTLVAVRRDGGWHVSLMASLAEAIRLEADDPADFPEADDAIAAVGAADPEAAVREMIDAATSVDVERMIELTDPVEAEVLHRYGSLLVDAADEADAEDPGVEISDLSLSVSDGPDGDRVVRAESITMTIRSDEETFTSSYADGCSEISWTYSEAYQQEVRDEYEGYAEEWGDELYEPDLSWLDGQSYRACRDDVLAPEGLIGSFQSPGLLSVVVTERDGAWYVRPAATIVETMLDAVRAVDRDQLERTVRIWTGEWWLSAPGSFWEACGVEPPADDASFDDAEAAYERCYDQLPEDYDFSDWPFGSLFGPGYGGSGSFETIEPDETFSDYEPTPDEACYSDEAYESDDPDAAILACLEDLAADGQIDPSVVDEFRCGLVYQAIPYDDDLTDEELDARYEQADDAYEACMAGEAAPTTTVPAPTTTTTRPPATTTTTRPPATTSTTAPPVTTTTGP